MFDVYRDAVVIVMSIANPRRENFGRKEMSSNCVWTCVATETMWRVSGVRSRCEQLKPERLGRRRCRDETVERRARLMMTNKVNDSIRDRPRVVSRQLSTMVPGRADNNRWAWPACSQCTGVQEANASPRATVWDARYFRVMYKNGLSNWIEYGGNFAIFVEYVDPVMR